MSLGFHPCVTQSQEISTPNKLVIIHLDEVDILLFTSTTLRSKKNLKALFFLAKPGNHLNLFPSVSLIYHTTQKRGGVSVSPKDTVINPLRGYAPLMSCRFKCMQICRILYLENDRRAGFLLKDAVGAQRLEVRVGVVEEVGVVVDQERLHIVEDESKLISMFHCVQAWEVLCHEGGGEAAHSGGVQHFTHLKIKKTDM